jgi:hypothetical protein
MTRFGRTAGGVVLLAFVLTMLPMQAAFAAPTIATRFVEYYDAHQGGRVLGGTQTDLVFVYGYPAQYFEKGRIEDHRGESANAEWAFAYGRLTAEMMETNPSGSVSTTSIKYSDLAEAHRPEKRTPAPAVLKQGTIMSREGMFVPYDPALLAAPGYFVPDFFWNYINRADLFPGGWLHDIGLPMTDAMQATVVKNGQQRSIVLQAFERTVLTYDGLNPASFRVERGNIGADAALFADEIGMSEKGQVRVPTAGATVTLPLHIHAYVKGPERRVTAELTWNDGTVLTDTLDVLREDEAGVIIGSIDWLTEGPPPRPNTKQATLRLKAENGSVISQQNVTVLPFDDPGTQQIKVYWLDGERVEAVTQVIPRTEGVGKAALEELLWGPGPRVTAFPAFDTALPTPAEVLIYQGRQADWGPRVTLRGLKIENGVATADFSKEMRAYGGGSARVNAIRGQITETLKQFPAVREVRIAIEGQTDGVLEP